MSLSSNIRFLRKEKGWSQDYIAEQLGYKSFTTIQKWESGVAEPPIKKLKALAELFNIDMDELANGNLVDNHSSIKSLAGVRIPVLGEIVAGLPIDAYQEILDYEEIPAALASQGEFFALKVKGDSMSPRIADGDVVICKQQSDIESGDIAVVTINGDTATLKKVVKHSTGITLVALNTAVFQPQFFTNEEVISLPITIQGKVIELRAKF